MSWLDFTKYPPSLDFLLLTLGAACLLLRAFEYADNGLTAVIRTFGGAPMFFYLLHLYVLLVFQKLAVALVGANHGDRFGVDHVYWIWIMAAVLAVLLYFPCRAFARFKRRTRQALGALLLMNATEFETGLPDPGIAAEDLPDALRLTQALPWSHTLQDWQLHFRVGRGFAATDDAGRLLGTILWWPYGEHYGSVGLVVVSAGAQGRGIGRALMDTVLSDAGSRSLQLVATEAGLKLYRQCGFCELGPSSSTRAASSARPLRRCRPGRDCCRPMRRHLQHSLRTGSAGLWRRPRRACWASCCAGAAARWRKWMGARPGSRCIARRAPVPRLARSSPPIPRWRWRCSRRNCVASTASCASTLPLHDWRSPTGWSNPAWPASIASSRMLRGRPPPRSSAMRIFGLISQAFG